ncbi:MAG: hypothetical protein ABI389_05815 [Rhodanobacter sp.]
MTTDAAPLTMPRHSASRGCLQILIPLLMAMRAHRLGRPFRDIERSIGVLPKRNRAG